MEKPIVYFVFGVQFIALTSVFLAFLFLVGFGGGLDLIGYDFPGLDETCMILPFGLPFTVIIYVMYLKLRNHRLASLLMVVAFVLNSILAFQALRVLAALISWFV